MHSHISSVYVTRVEHLSIGGFGWGWRGDEGEGETAQFVVRMFGRKGEQYAHTYVQLNTYIEMQIANEITRC